MKSTNESERDQSFQTIRLVCELKLNLPHLLRHRFDQITHRNIVFLCICMCLLVPCNPNKLMTDEIEGIQQYSHLPQCAVVENHYFASNYGVPENLNALDFSTSAINENRKKHPRMKYRKKDQWNTKESHPVWSNENNACDVAVNKNGKKIRLQSRVREKYVAPMSLVVSVRDILTFCDFWIIIFNSLRILQNFASSWGTFYNIILLATATKIFC